MAYIKKIRGRGASGVVTAYGEVLFAPGGPVNSWTNRFAQRIGAETRKAAPKNKRPRWAHYGKPLRSTITASRPEFRPTRAGARVYAAVGSTAPYAYYVDQGTGIFGGGGPYQAKILPPWSHGSGSLYEHTWVPPGSTRPIGTVTVKGQPGQEFFAKGLNRAFDKAVRRAAQKPAEGVLGMTRALASFPRGLEFDGNTPATGLFVPQLNEWRAWRRERFDSGRPLGHGDTNWTNRRRLRADNAAQRRREKREANAYRRKQLSAERSKKWREAQKKAKGTEKPKRRQDEEKRQQQKRSLREERSKFLAAVQKKYGADKVDRGSLEFRDGHWEIVVKARGKDGRVEFRVVRGKSHVK